MAGIIAAALAAAGDAGVQSINQEIQRQDQSDRDQAMAKLQTQKELTILAAQKQARIDEYNQMREQQQTRINSFLPQVAQEKVNQQYAPSDQAVAAADAGQTAAPLTPEQRDVIAQSRKADYASLANDPQSYVQAAMRSGDLDPHAIASLVQQENAFRRQEASQQAQFDHSDASQKAMFEHADASQRASQVFQAGENEKTRSASAEARALDPAIIEANAQAIADGRMAPLSGYALRSPGASAIMARVLELKPEFSAKDYQISLGAEKTFNQGKRSDSVKAFNVALSHLDTLENAASALRNGDVKVFNKLGNAINEQTGHPAPTDFNAIKHIVADEITKSILGGPGAVADREAAAKTIESTNSPEQLQGVINRYKELMVGQLVGLRDQYQATTGKSDFEQKFLSNAARTLMGKLHQDGAGSAHPTATTVPNPVQPAAGARPSLDFIFGF